MSKNSKEIESIYVSCIESIPRQEDMDKDHCVSYRKELEYRMDEKYSSKKKKRFLTIRHLRTGIYGCVTAAGLVNPSSKSMSIGVSLCSPSDLFCKKNGRARALKRMHKKPFEININLDDEGINDSIITYLNLFSEKLFPKAKWINNFLKHYQHGVK